MDKTEDGQTIERTHDPRTTPDRVPLIPLPLLVAQLIDIFERAGTTRTYTELHAIRIVCFSLLDRSLAISFLSLCFSIQARALRAKPIHLECQSSWRSVKLSSILRPLRPSSNISQLAAQAGLVKITDCSTSRAHCPLSIDDVFVTAPRTISGILLFKQFIVTVGLISVTAPQEPSGCRNSECPVQPILYFLPVINPYAIFA